jgi:hypothetical protein
MIWGWWWKGGLCSSSGFPMFWDLFQSGRFFLPFVGKAIRDYHIKSEVRNSATFPLILQCSSLCAKVTTLQVQSWCWNLEWWVLQSKNVWCGVPNNRSRQWWWWWVLLYIYGPCHMNQNRNGGQMKYERAQWKGLICFGSRFNASWSGAQLRITRALNVQ